MFYGTDGTSQGVFLLGRFNKENQVDTINQSCEGQVSEVMHYWVACMATRNQPGSHRHDELTVPESTSIYDASKTSVIQVKMADDFQVTGWTGGFLPLNGRSFLHECRRN